MCQRIMQELVMRSSFNDKVVVFVYTEERVRIGGPTSWGLNALVDS